MPDHQREREELVAAYLRHAARVVHAPESVELASEPANEAADEASYWAVEERVRTAPPAEALALALDLVRAADEAVLGFVAAGPLEEIVAIHGTGIVASLEAAARREPRVRHALGCIWLSHGQLPAPVIARIVTASGGAIQPLSGARTATRAHRRAT
jgi:hypothetical protein